VTQKRRSVISEHRSTRSHNREIWQNKRRKFSIASCVLGEWSEREGVKKHLSISHEGITHTQPHFLPLYLHGTGRRFCAAVSIETASAPYTYKSQAGGILISNGEWVSEPRERKRSQPRAVRIDPHSIPGACVLLSSLVLLYLCVRCESKRVGALSLRKGVYYAARALQRISILCACALTRFRTSSRHYQRTQRKWKGLKAPN
jgi:hypothetical protein